MTTKITTTPSASTPAEELHSTEAATDETTETTADAAQENEQEAETPETTAREDAAAELQKQLDEWKGHSRKHETRAEKAAETIKNLEKEIETLKAAAEEATAASTRATIAAKHGLPVEAAKLLRGTDEKSITEEVNILLAIAGKAAPEPAKPRPSTVQGTPSNTKPKSAYEEALALLEAQLNG